MLREDIEKIVNASLNAPSGDNSQPWHFKCKDNVLTIYNIPERDQTLYNHKQFGSYLAHGALVENIVLAASRYHYAVEVEFCPDATQPDLVSRLTFSPSEKNEDPLVVYIPERATNRKRYKDVPLSDEIRKAFVTAAGDEVALQLVEAIDDRKKIARELSANERVLLENQTLHDVFFSHVRWTPEDEKLHKSGLYSKTLELEPPQLAVFKLCRNWSFLKVFNKIGLSRFIASQNAINYASGSVIGIVTIKNSTPALYAKAGRAIERIWLTAIKFGMSVQPVTAVAYLALRSRENIPGEFSSFHKQLVESADQNIRTVAHIGSEPIAMIFRVGYADKPSAYSSRQPATIVFE